MQFFGNVQALEQSGGIGFGGVAAVISDDSFQFAQTHAVLVGQVGLRVEDFALLQRVPQRRVPHDHRIQNAEGIERELILAQNADLLRPGDGALGWLDLTGQDFHERRLAGSVGTGDRVAPSLLERGGYVFEQNTRAEAHGNVVYRDQNRGLY